MKSQRRRVLQVALVSCLAFAFVSFIAPNLVTSQEHK